MMVQPSTMKLLRMAVVIKKSASNSLIFRTNRNIRSSRKRRPRRRIWEFTGRPCQARPKAQTKTTTKSRRFQPSQKNFSRSTQSLSTTSREKMMPKVNSATSKASVAPGHRRCAPSCLSPSSLPRSKPLYWASKAKMMAFTTMRKLIVQSQRGCFSMSAKYLFLDPFHRNAVELFFRKKSFFSDFARGECPGVLGHGGSNSFFICSASPAASPPITPFRPSHAAAA
mmetsp:Transcript_115343/g.274161  ORF Transcript_115343/g.274161 Transcript_115343/m.274161 type:complete len:226 (-) Transcript_115343:211-888(-)